MKIRIVNHSRHALPSYETNASAGMDLLANLTEDVLLKPLGRALDSHWFIHRITNWIRSPGEAGK